MHQQGEIFLQNLEGPHPTRACWHPKLAAGSSHFVFSEMLSLNLHTSLNALACKHNKLYQIVTIVKIKSSGIK